MDLAKVGIWRSSASVYRHVTNFKCFRATVGSQKIKEMVNWNENCLLLEVRKRNLFFGDETLVFFR